MIGIKGVAKKPILDATAKPEDVASGKIFYNNSGKCIGSATVDQSKTFDIHLSWSQLNTTSTYYYPSDSIFIISPENKIVKEYRGGETIQLRCGITYIPKINALTGVTYAGAYFRVGIMAESMVLCYSNVYSPIMRIQTTDSNMTEYSTMLTVFTDTIFTLHYI